MTRDEAVARIKELLHYRTAGDDTVVEFMKLAQKELEEEPERPWFLLSEDATINTAIGEDRIPVPSDFIIEADEDALTYLPTSATEKPVPLFKDDLDELRATYANADAGAPEAYALAGMYFRIFPTPDDVYTLRMNYYFKDEVLTTNIENRWLLHAPSILIGKAGLYVARTLKNTEAAQTFMQMEVAGRDRLIKHNIERGLANRELQIGGRH